jgi:hypothetical protein
VWVLRVLVILGLAVALNVVFWFVLPGYGVEAPPWFVIAFDVLFIVPLFWLLPSVAPHPARATGVAADADRRWGKRGVGAFPGVDESRDRLHAAGWSVGEIATTTLWVVTGSNGENLLHAEGFSQAEAWHRACEQAAAVGMLAAARERERPSPGRF